MNFAQETYKNLVELVKSDESFTFKDFSLQEKVYRIFNYRLASWTSFMAPSALNCRGTMYDITNNEDVKLVSLPPEKFFNYEEGGVDHTVGKIGDKMVKMDGSLISTYLHDDELYFKSKGSLFSSQALDAMKLMNLEENKKFKSELKSLINLGFTVNLEYTSPENRIVIPYQSEELTVLSVRSHDTGNNYFATKLNKLLSEHGFDEIKKNMVVHESLHGQEIKHSKFVDDIRLEQEGEGYVVEIVVNEDLSYLTKIKNIKYITLHNTKDSVNSPKRLFEAVIEEATDDLRAMFADDEYVLSKVTEMEKTVQPIFNHMVKTVESFVDENKNLDRKDFAIKAKSEHSNFMGLLMNGYLGQKIDYKFFAKKHAKDMFGIGEDPVEDLEDSFPHKMKNKI
ncbi:RNA ligase, T4 RnlA family [archaeon]|nr:RNA ligase, T4 RnlA family [archaeon]